jgi:hypothetical protein
MTVFGGPIGGQHSKRVVLRTVIDEPAIGSFRFRISHCPIGPCLPILKPLAHCVIRGFQILLTYQGTVRPK